MKAVAKVDSNIQVIQSPDTFIQQAIEKGSDVSVLSGLFDLKQLLSKPLQILSSLTMPQQKANPL